jgi:hypothetical protein
VLRFDKRNLFVFASRYLKLMISEEICGRFGSFDEQTTAYRLTRATSNEGVRLCKVSFTVC